MAAANVVLVLLDGGAGLEDCALNAVSGLSRETVLILDFHHAHEHLVEFAKVYHEEATSRAALVSRWSDLLKEHGGKTLLETLSALDLTDRSETVRESHRQLLGYIRHNVHRMDYPTYLKNGWPIGSGVIESACKRVIAKRLKAPGMRGANGARTPWPTPAASTSAPTTAGNSSGPTSLEDSYRRLGCTHRLTKQECRKLTGRIWKARMGSPEQAFAPPLQKSPILVHHSSINPLTMKNSIPILIVDDLPANLAVLEAVLDSPDYHLVMVQTCQEALLALLNGDFAAVLLDVKLPDMSGFELCTMIKNRKRSRNLPVIFLSSHHTDASDRQFGYYVGGVDYIAKPFDPVVLRAKVKVFADLYRQRTELLVEAAPSGATTPGLSKSSRSSVAPGRLATEHGTAHPHPDR